MQANHDHNHVLARAAEAVGRVVRGKDAQVRLALACFLARGHLLLEDLPGVGKTTLAQALARVLGLGFRRIQCTADLLPGDVLGVSVFDRRDGSFVFHPGPVFTQVLLADELNRATPKAQSALLEAMEERQATVEGATRPLPEPFFLVATQNPLEHAGVFPLPDSQLDRFLLRLSLGYPDREEEQGLLDAGGAARDLAELAPVLDAAGAVALQEKAGAVHAAPALTAYVLDLVEHTRLCGDFAAGLSPRAGLGLLAAAKAHALLASREHALPEDVQAVFPAVAGHRLRRRDTLAGPGPDGIADLLAAVPVS